MAATLIATGKRSRLLTRGMPSLVVHLLADEFGTMLNRLRGKL